MPNPKKRRKFLILAAIAVVVYGTYKVLGNNIATLASGVDSALTSA